MNATDKLVWLDYTEPIVQEDKTRTICWRRVDSENGRVYVEVTQEVHPTNMQPELAWMHVYLLGMKIPFTSVEKAKKFAEESMKMETATATFPQGVQHVC